jgi:hypothetical protein
MNERGESEHSSVASWRSPSRFERRDEQGGLTRQVKRALEVCVTQSPRGLCEEGARIVEGFAICAGKPRSAEFGDSLPDVILQPLDLAAQSRFLGRTLARLQ